MQLTSATRLRETPATCDGWTTARPTGSLEALEYDRVDRYSMTLHGLRDEEPPETFARAVDLLLRYRLFPPHRMEARVCTANGRIARNATIVQRVFLGPLAVESAVRVEEVFDDPTFAGRRVGFSYVTLDGHPARGAESFALLLHETGLIELAATAASRPGSLLVSLGYPVARWFQRHSTREAFLYFRSLVAYGGDGRVPTAAAATS
jgi:uncharacterized protein (UPF0548 family)